MKKITMQTVAARAGVSVATVSRVFNGNERVDPSIIQRVRAAAQELGYRPTVNPTLLAEKAQQIALIVPTIENSYYSSIATGVIDAAQQNGHRVTVLLSGAAHEQEMKCLSELNGTGIIGIIYAGRSGRMLREGLPGLQSIPMVIAARRCVKPGVPHIYADNEKAGYLATKYLLRLKKRRIALFLNFWTSDIKDYQSFLRVPPPLHGAFTAYDRYDGYCRALYEAGISPDPSLIFFGGYSHEDGFRGAEALLSGNTEFDAVLTPNDQFATGLIHMLDRQHIRVPEQLSVICLNGGLLSNVVTPPLTYIEQDNYGLGVQAAAQLNELLCGRPGHDVKMDVSLVIRDSTAMAPEGAE